jgi:hypothetical protein
MASLRSRRAVLLCVVGSVRRFEARGRGGGACAGTRARFCYASVGLRMRVGVWTCSVGVNAKPHVTDTHGRDTGQQRMRLRIGRGGEMTPALALAPKLI